MIKTKAGKMEVDASGKHTLYTPHGIGSATGAPARPELATNESKAATVAGAADVPKPGEVLSGSGMGPATTAVVQRGLSDLYKGSGVPAPATQAQGAGTKPGPLFPLAGPKAPVRPPAAAADAAGKPGPVSAPQPGPVPVPVPASPPAPASPPLPPPADAGVKVAGTGAGQTSLHTNQYGQTSFAAKGAAGTAGPAVDLERLRLKRGPGMMV